MFGGGICMKIWKNSVLFYLGGSAYMLLEFLWRGRSHGSMFVLGGLCFLIVGKLGTALKQVPLALRLVMSSGIITALELLTGLFVNQNYTVWDYRNLPYNYLGHICLIYSLLWMPVSLGAMHLYRKTAEAVRP